MECRFARIRPSRWLMALGTLAGPFLFAGLAGCGRGEATVLSSAPGSPLADERVVKVAAVEASPRVWPRVVRVQGSLLGDERVVVGAKVAGRIQSIGESDGPPIDLGTFVEAGDALATLEPEDFELQVAEAEAQLSQVRATLGLALDQDEADLDPLEVPSVLQEKVLWDEAQAHWERAEALSLQTAISNEELQQRKALVDVAAARYQAALHRMNESVALLSIRRAQLALAQQHQRDAVIRAPFAGIVEQRFVAPGAYVQVGAPVVALVRIDPLRFHAGVPERDVPGLKLGQAVEILLEGEPQPLVAAVTRISPSLDLSSRALTIEADLPNPDLRWRMGLFAEAQIVVDPDATALAVPAGAVREFAGVQKVWTVREGRAVEQPVQIGRRSDEWVEITGGVASGDLVIVEGALTRPGPVEVAQSL